MVRSQFGVAVSGSGPRASTSGSRRCPTIFAAGDPTSPSSASAGSARGRRGPTPGRRCWPNTYLQAREAVVRARRRRWCGCRCRCCRCTPGWWCCRCWASWGPSARSRSPRALLAAVAGRAAYAFSSMSRACRASTPTRVVPLLARAGGDRAAGATPVLVGIQPQWHVEGRCGVSFRAPTLHLSHESGLHYALRGLGVELHADALDSVRRGHSGLGACPKWASVRIGHVPGGMSCGACRAARVSRRGGAERRGSWRREQGVEVERALVADAVDEEGRGAGGAADGPAVAVAAEAF